MSISLLFLIPSLASASAAVALDGPLAPGAASNASAGYCQYITGVADSESSLLMSPQIYAHFGVLNGAGFLSTDIYTPPPTSLRLTLGLKYSAAKLAQGLTLRSRAQAECERYAVVSELHDFLQANKEAVTRPALEAKAAVLREALPEAERILGVTKGAVDQGAATVEELDGTRLRIDTLRGVLAETSARMESLPTMRPPPAPIAELLRQRERLEDRVERYEARMRLMEAWDVSVQAGYDQIFGAVNQVPAFGSLTLTLNPALFFQHRAEARALKGRRLWAGKQVEGPSRRVEVLIEELRAVRRSEQGRLRETGVLLADLGARLKSLEGIGAKQAQRYRDHVWFELITARAEHTYLRAHLKDLAELLGDEEAR